MYSAVERNNFTPPNQQQQPLYRKFHLLFTFFKNVFKNYIALDFRNIYFGEFYYFVSNSPCITFWTGILTFKKKK